MNSESSNIDEKSFRYAKIYPAVPVHEYKSSKIKSHSIIAINESHEYPTEQPNNGDEENSSKAGK